MDNRSNNKQIDFCRDETEIIMQTIPDQNNLSKKISGYSKFTQGRFNLFAVVSKTV